jgi:hypothetical protein
MGEGEDGGAEKVKSLSTPTFILPRRGKETKKMRLDNTIA